MKRFNLLALLAVALLAWAVSSCSEDNTFEPVMPDSDGTATGTTGSTTTGATASIGDLTSFDIAVDSTTTVDDSETISSDDEDCVENSTFDSEILIHYESGSATVTGSVSGVTVTTDGAHVTVNSTVKGVCYTLSGTTTNGSFKIYGEKKFELKLNGVNITNPTGAAINSQCGKRGLRGACRRHLQHADRRHHLRHPPTART